MIQHTFTGSTTQTIITTRSGRRVVFLGVDIELYKKGLETYANGELIQQAFPFLSADQREFLISGLTPEEFKALYSDEE